MRGLRAALNEHRHFIIVVTLLTIVMTYPTIVYVFRTDIFALPTGTSEDAFVKIWDSWYGGQVIAGNAHRFYTDLIYYPVGVTLTRHQLFPFYGITVSGLQLFIPFSNAFNLTYLLITFTCVLTAYIYLDWLFKDKWIALLGAVIFGFSLHVTTRPDWPEVAWIAPLPLAIYCVHRGILEKRAALIVLGGLVAGLTAEVTMYLYVVVLITLGLLVGGLAVSRWREKDFWRQALLLTFSVALSSAWRLIPMLQDSAAFETALQWYGDADRSTDLVSFFVSRRHPFLGPSAKAFFKTPDDVQLSNVSYLGILPLLLVISGLLGNSSRRKMLPWLGLFLAFAILVLGSTLIVNGVSFEHIRLPKHYLGQYLPTPFKAFHLTYLFMPGVVLSLAILACFGLESLQGRFAAATRPGFILLLIAIVAFEYYQPTPTTFSDPIAGNPYSEERFAFVDWLKREEVENIRLINLPFGRDNAKVYMFYQTLSGFPQVEGSISRAPVNVYDYFRANPVLSIWLEQRPTNCVIQDRDEYFEGLTQLAEDGFTHIIHHYGFYFWQRHIENFRYVEPANSDDYVSIYRMSDMLESCPS